MPLTDVRIRNAKPLEKPYKLSVSAPSRVSPKSFFESTNKATVSAKALSLRRISRSSSWMRRRSLRVSSGLARTSAGVANAAIA